MLAIDTNVVVRYLTADDPAQAQKAKAVIDAQDVFLATTVLLETEWVLRSAYGYDATAVLGALRRFASMARVNLQDPPLVACALDWAEQGMDFADALHLAAAKGCEGFVTFDRNMARSTPPNAPTVRAP